MLGIATIICIFHDAVIMIAMYGIFHMTINNPFIAAILTVIGYSTNDTIVIFTRIRENMGIMRRQPLDVVVDTSVNQTLVRSIMTTITTVATITPLIFIGGEVIRQYAVPLVIGIVVGTLSSIFIASPLFYDLAKKSYKYGGSKYRGAEKGSAPSDKKLPEAKAELGYDEEEPGEDEKPAPRPSGGSKGKKKKSKAKRKPSGNGAVV